MGGLRQTGADVKDFGVSDAVLGYSWTRSSHATHTVVPATQLIGKPEALPWEVAGALDVAGTTAYAAVRAAAPGPGDVVAVSAATGGVGTLVVQLLVQRGATVLGIASAPSAEWLTDHGVIAFEYGDGISDRLRSAAPNGIDAFIDLFGPEYVRLAADLGVEIHRIKTIVFSPAATGLGVQVAGAAALSDAEVPAVLIELANLLATRAVELPIAATYPLDRVADAFEQLERRDTHSRQDRSPALTGVQHAERPAGTVTPQRIADPVSRSSCGTPATTSPDPSPQNDHLRALREPNTADD